MYKVSLRISSTQNNERVDSNVAANAGRGSLDRAVS